MDRTEIFTDLYKILVAMQERRDLHYLAADQYRDAGKWKDANTEYDKAAGISEAITIFITKGKGWNT